MMGLYLAFNVCVIYCKIFFYMSNFLRCLEKFGGLYPDAASQIGKIQAVDLPFIDAKSWVEKMDLRPIQDLIVYGVGRGELYGAVKKWLYQGYDKTLIFLEEDLNNLRALFETEVGWEILTDDRVELLYFKREEPGALFNRLMWQGVKRNRLVIGDPRTYPDQFRQVENILKFDQDKMGWLNRDYQVFGLGYYYNFYHNLMEFPDCYDGTGLFGEKRDIPAVIVGAGPSLDKNGHLLGQVLNKAAIFAGGSALPALKQFGIKPHFGGGIDPNITQCERIASFGKVDFPYLFSTRVNAQALKMIAGPKVHIPSTGGYDTALWINERLGIPKAKIDEGFNVVHFMTECARQMGCNPIIFIGLDLSLPNNVHYAKGVSQPEEMPDDLVQTQDIYGNPTVSRWMWLKESLWLSEFAKKYPDIRCINATEGGIGFAGVPNIPFSEVIASLKSAYDIPSLFPLKKLPVTPSEISSLLSELFESLQRIDLILDGLRTSYETIDLRGEIKFSEGLEELRKESGFLAILATFHAYCLNLIASSHTAYLIQRDGWNSKLGRRMLQLHLQKISYLKETVKGQLGLLEPFLTTP